MYTAHLHRHARRLADRRSIAGLMPSPSAIVLWIASRIYRVGILMYGKKPNLPEILRWLKYS